MLVLSRKKNESVVINEDITIVVVEVRGDKVRIGVEAPKHVPVLRGEVHQAILRYEDRTPDFAPVDWAPPTSGHQASDRAGAVAVEAAPRVAAAEELPAHDGLACPACQSDAVSVNRIKIAFKGKELVRWRKCVDCGHEFQTIERVEQL